MNLVRERTGSRLLTSDIYWHVDTADLLKPFLHDANWLKPGLALFPDENKKRGRTNA